MKNIFSNQFIRYGLFVIIGLFLGWVFFHPEPKTDEGHIHTDGEKNPDVWTCAMHPQIRMEKQGKCPICAMDLVLVSQSGGAGIDPDAIHLTKEAAQLANVLTSVVTTQKPVKEVRLYGKVQADERLIQSQVAFIPGRIEKLHVNFTGETVRKGQPLATIYSPELVTAQQELLEAVKSRQTQPEIYDAAKERLRQWKITDYQIDAIENSGKIQSNMDVVSTANGIVTARRVNNGDYISQGSVLFEVTDLSHVWVQFDAYESDLQFLNKGYKVHFTIQAMQGENYSGNIVFIDPSIDPVSRIAKVRVEINNLSGKLKPEMFATGVVQANLDAFRNHLVIPRSAVLWTGKRSLVYVKIPGDEPVFKIREVGLGPVLGNSFVITGGLSEGEEIVTEGAFSVDAAAQLEGKPSMMNRQVAASDDMTGSNSVSSQNPGSDKLHSQLTFKVYGACEMCKDRIEKAARSIAGLASAEWSAEDNLLKVSADLKKTSSEKIQKLIAESGHDTELYRAADEVYNKLPDCCKYERPK